MVVVAAVAAAVAAAAAAAARRLVGRVTGRRAGGQAIVSSINAFERQLKTKFGLAKDDIKRLEVLRKHAFFWLDSPQRQR